MLNGGVPATKSVKVQPIQFHFHAPSEHTLDGYLVRFPTFLASTLTPPQACHSKSEAYDSAPARVQCSHRFCCVLPAATVLSKPSNPFARMSWRL